jgi:hypothetical protein
MARPRSGSRFEYHRERLKQKSDKATDRLNELGAEGWELVGVDDGWAYLKRPKQAAARSPQKASGSDTS